MDVAIINRFGILLAEKRVREKRNIPVSEVAESTGLPRKTLQAWATNTVTRFDVHVMNAICAYFGIKPGELFDYVPDPEFPLPPEKRAGARPFSYLDPEEGPEEKPEE